MDGSQLGTFDQRIEVLIIPVSDVDRSSAFYQSLGWRLDVTPPGVVQLTPPGSSASVQFGAGLNPAQPGSSSAYLVVTDLVAAREALVAAGVEVSDYFHRGPDGFTPGLDPERQTYASRATFADPDGNLWILQEITTRLPGR
ncbi:glyoxalase [Kribbella sandramycini]|uniref:Catechol 2,3-dioxygenase-like lactoylglutathione lyase family enzyme n=1 Tax=Kribbella sandramycini TaxID=60450 RepID=A0A7Y4L1W4_9ACTN|nr:VOC family protein [Kribbella sandramycini]MBB6566556.1 catechol 2,3-dioxygenase-like lactoylglutathione lyase family enzyme [Kribbella sandramycini]NOL42787.1 glyoxalase [Kribbella sandramycini]